MATKYELPEQADASILSNLGEEVEMKTFKTNVLPTLECDKDQALVIKIICLGGYMFGVGRKGELIKDFLQGTQPARIGYYPPLLIGCDFHVKTIKCKKGDDRNPSMTIKLQFWEMAAEGEHILLNICCRNSHGALVFWDPTCALSLDRVPKWLKDAKNKAYPSIPCVLVTVNLSKKPLYGPGETFESETAFDQFWKDHGFIGHFEIKFRDWQSGEDSVFGQAVNCLIEKILCEQT